MQIFVISQVYLVGESFATNITDKCAVVVSFVISIFFGVGTNFITKQTLDVFTFRMGNTVHKTGCTPRKCLLTEFASVLKCFFGVSLLKKKYSNFTLQKKHNRLPVCAFLIHVPSGLLLSQNLREIQGVNLKMYHP